MSDRLTIGLTLIALGAVVWVLKIALWFALVLVLAGSALVVAAALRR